MVAEKYVLERMLQIKMGIFFFIFNRVIVAYGLKYLYHCCAIYGHHNGQDKTAGTKFFISNMIFMYYNMKKQRKLQETVVMTTYKLLTYLNTLFFINIKIF